MFLGKKRHQYLFFVVVPTLLAVIYYSFFATGMYLSEARFSVRGPEGGPGGSELMILLGQNSGGVVADAYVIRDYIHSLDMLVKLDERLQLREHYSDRNADILSRLAQDASVEEFTEYYRKVVEINFDPSSSIMTLRVRAYTPDMARLMVENVLELSEQIVNDLRERSLRDSLTLARSELTIAEQRVSESREALKGFRDIRELLNPQATAGSLLALVAQLEADAARVRTELAEVRAYMRDESARVVALKARIAALEEQIKDEKSRLTGSDKRVLNEVVSDYERLLTEQEFAQKQYVSAMTSLETARVQAQAKSRYLVVFSSPHQPDESVWPKRIRSSILFFVFASLIFGIISLVIAAVREHAGY